MWLVDLILFIGHAQLVSIMRYLSSFAAEKNICVLLINGVVGGGTRPPPPPTLPSSSISDESHYHHHIHFQQQNQNQVSIFASTYGKPALGKTFMYCVDTHLFLSKVPRRKEDAEKMMMMAAAAAGRRRDSSTRYWRRGNNNDHDDNDDRHALTADKNKPEFWKEVRVCEVLTDRLAGKEGRWGCFDIVSAFFFPLCFFLCLRIERAGVMYG